MTGKAQFTVLEGGRDKQATINNISLSVVPNSLCPLPIDVRVFEEDTYLILTIDPVIRYTDEHPIRLMTGIMETQPGRPGSVITNNASWYAIVHDMNADPTWHREWIEKAYRTTFILAQKKRVQRIGLPLLGSVHGKFSLDESLAMLIQIIKKMSFQYLKKILILTPPQNQKNTIQLLRQLTRWPVYR